MDDRLNKYNNRTKKFNTDDIKIDIKFDISQLDLLCAYVVSNDPLIKRSNLNNLATIIKVINLDNYKGDKGLLDRLDYISKGLDAKLNKNLVNSDMVIMDINGGLGGHSNIQTRELNRDEIVWVNNAISEIIKHISIYEEIDKASELITEFKSTDFINRAPVVKKIEEWTTRLQNKFRKAKADISDEMMFSLIGDRYVDTIHDTFNQIKSPSNKLVFGTQALNIITGGGVFCEKVYVILGLPGEGKSSTLLDMALEIKKYNKDYKCKIPGKRPCVVLLIMENSIKETIERMFSMVTCGSNMDAYSSYEQIPQELEKHGLKISDDDPIDLIIKFKPNLSVDTGYLYELVEDLEDEGYEVICLIQDYLKRIRSVEGSFGGDLKLELGAAVDELKEFATINNIPVVTASQLNGISSIQDYQFILIYSDRMLGIDYCHDIKGLLNAIIEWNNYMYPGNKNLVRSDDDNSDAISTLSRSEAKAMFNRIKLEEISFTLDSMSFTIFDNDSHKKIYEIIYRIRDNNVYIVSIEFIPLEDK